MMPTTIAISPASHKTLAVLKAEEGFKSMDELIRQLVIEHKKNKLIRASEMVRSRMEELDLSLSDLIE
jgi:hypothetical protein